MMNSITKFFQKNPPIMIEEHIYKLVKKPNILFQIDFIRNNQIDIQITRQKLLRGLKLKITNPKGFALSLTFNSERKDNITHFNNFKESNLFNEKLKIELGGNDFFFVYCDNNFEGISKLLNRAMFEIFNYKNDEVYQFTYREHE